MTRILTDIKIKGEVVGGQDVYVDGEIERAIALPDHALVIGPKGRVRAQVKARSVTISGYLEGKVQVGEKTELRKAGSLVGDLVTARIAIEDGGVFRGSIDILQPEIKEQDAPRASGMDPGL